MSVGNFVRNEEFSRHRGYMALIKRFLFQLVLVAVGLLILFNSLPIFAFAASSKDLEVAGWIPYWNESKGIVDAQQNINKVDMVFPFSFTTKEDGTLKDLADMKGSEWGKFISLAHVKGVKIVPTVMWSDASSTHANLSDKDLRKSHVSNIVEMVKDGGYDGVDIDYESKFSTTKEHFSAFLTELKKALGKNKILACTIEARTPPASLYKKIPDPLLYANDFVVIGSVCDRVEIMAYDQQRADLKLNDIRSGMPYIPVSDVAWVEKVVKLALVDIPREKILLGIPSYGHQYTVTVGPNWFKDYKRIGALNIPDILDIASEYTVRPTRNAAGEMSFSYIPKSSKFTFPRNLKIPRGTKNGDKVAAQALAYANKTGKDVQFNYVSYSDVHAMEDKIKLAKDYGLHGIAFFKFDGEEDQKVWKLLP